MTSDTRYSYVVGFIYNDNLEQVLLQLKDRNWQKGRFNGIGGGIQGAESPIRAMRRETLEEVSSTRENPAVIEWVPGPRLIFSDGVYLFTFFAALEDQEFLALTQPDEAEELVRYDINDLPARWLLVEHVAWLIRFGVHILANDDGLNSIHYSHGTLPRL